MSARVILQMLAPAVLAAVATTDVRPIERKASVTSSDGVVTVQNVDTGKGGTMPELVTTVTWKDGKGASRKTVFEDEGRLGWVESIGVFATKPGPTYVLIAEDKQATTTFELRMVAFRRSADGTSLDEAPDFFPSLDGESGAASEIAVEYHRRRGVDVFPRPLEARIDEAAGRVTVAIFPEAANAKRGPKIENAEPAQSFSLVLEGDRLVAADLDDADRKVLFPDG